MLWKSNQVNMIQVNETKKKNMYFGGPFDIWI